MSYDLINYNVNIPRCYGDYDYLNFPEMKRMLDEAIDHPEHELKIKPNFLKRKVTKNLFVQLSHAIQHAFIYLHKTFSESYRNKYKNAVVKIGNTFNLARNEQVLLAKEEAREKLLYGGLKKKEALQKLSGLKPALQVREQIEMNTSKIDNLWDKKKKVLTEIENRERNIEQLKSKFLYYDNLFKTVQKHLDNENKIFPASKREELKHKIKEADETYKEVGFKALYFQGRIRNNKKMLAGYIRDLNAKKEQWRKNIENEKTELQKLKGVSLSSLDYDISVLETVNKKLQRNMDEMQGKKVVKKPSKEKEPIVNGEKAPVQKTETPTTVEGRVAALGEIGKKMVEDIGSQTHEDMKIVWLTFLERFFKPQEGQPGSWNFQGGKLVKSKTNNAMDTNVMVEWKKNPNGSYTLKLSQPLRLWVTSTDEKGNEDPKGGVILMLGANQDREVIIKFDSNAKKMDFIKGFDVCTNNILLNRMKAFAPVNSMTWRSTDNIGFEAGMDMKNIPWLLRPIVKTFATVKNNRAVKERKKSFENLTTNWGKNGEVLHFPGDKQNHKKEFDILKAMLDQKIALSK